MKESSVKNTPEYVIEKLKSILGVDTVYPTSEQLATRVATEFIRSPSDTLLRATINFLMGGEYTLSPSQQIDFNKLLQEYTVTPSPVETPMKSTAQMQKELRDKLVNTRCEFEEKLAEEKIRAIVRSEKPADTTQAILTERGARYGKFKDHAHITQVFMQNSEVFLKEIHNTNLENKLSRSQREALHMIFHKIGRILNGDPKYADSWADIAGYARLVADELEGVER